MRRLIESTLVSLGGAIEAPERWAVFDAEATAHAGEELGNFDAFVMGRVTYEKFLASRGHVTGNPYVDLIGAMPTHTGTRPSAGRPCVWAPLEGRHRVLSP